MAKNIKIAPSRDEYVFDRNVVSVEFNHMRLRYIMAVEEIEEGQKDALCDCISMAIALCSKTWLLRQLLDDCIQIDGKPAGRLEVTSI